MKKQNIGWIFACGTLTFLLIISVILGVTGFFSSLTYLKSNGDLVVGDDVSISVKPNEASVVSFTFDGSYLPDQVIPHIIQINNSSLDSDLRLRVKAKIFGLREDLNLDFVTTSHFEKAEDGYYYFDDTLKGGNKITFSNYIKIPDSHEFASGEKYVLTIVVETLETKYDKNIWKFSEI